MTKSQALQWKIACWILVGGFTTASACFGWTVVLSRCLIGPSPFTDCVVVATIRSVKMPRIRTIRNIGLILALVIGFLWLLPNLLNRQYFALRHKSAKWYADFTAACDSVIASHPAGTNAGVAGVAIAVTDPSLPKIITDLHPLKIHVGPQRFWMLLVSDSHAGFGLTWDPKWDETNIWVLHTTAESLDTVIYSAKR